jgi:deoxyribodipyrimidine photo-lyase
MEKALDSALVWFRRDLRADDQAALYHALRAARRVWCVFVFDHEILDPLPRVDRRVEFIHASVVALDRQLGRLAPGAGLIVRHGWAADDIARLAQALHVQAVYTNHDDEPAALARDAKVRGALADAGIALHTSKDHVVFERSELLTGSGKPYSVFTPYKNAWLKKLEPFFLKAYPVEKYAASLASLPADLRGGVPTLAAIGFQPTNLHTLKMPALPAGIFSVCRLVG